ncbi:MAG: aminotransferase class V-fold PLP-dependent enzyme [Gammaproteobacteria bacterium]
MQISDEFPAARKCTYLNNASVALMPRLAADYLEAWQRDIADNGTLNFDEVAEEKVFDDLRASFAALLGCTAIDIAVASSASEMIASIAWAVMPAKGTKIVTTDVIFPSTAYPWARVARHTGAEMQYVAAGHAVIDEEALIAAIDERTSVVSICHVEYSTGQRFDLSRIARACQAVGAFLLVDASQSVGAVPIDVVATGVDALVTTSYKWLCGPFGVGLLYLAPRWQTRLDPGITGWRSNAAVYDLQADRCVHHEDARRFEFSTMAYGCAGALARSIDYLRALGIGKILEHNMALIDRLVQGADSLGIHPVSPMGPGQRSSIASFLLPGVPNREAVKRLGTQNIVVSARRDYVRVSPHIYTSEADIDRLVAALEDIVR